MLYYSIYYTILYYTIVYYNPANAADLFHGVFKSAPHGQNTSKTLMLTLPNTLITTARALQNTYKIQNKDP